MNLYTGEWALIIALTLFLIISIWYSVQVTRRRKRVMSYLVSLARMWSEQEAQENQIAKETDDNHMTYPVHVAKASVYRGCTLDLQRALHVLTHSPTQRV